MARAQQKRTLETRTRLIAASEEIIDKRGFEELRVEDVVLSAGTAKGTFFAHFKDKNALMDLIIGGRIDQHLDKLEALAMPNTVEELVEALIPLSDFMTSERYVFDLILRYSGAAAVEEIGHIALTFARQIEILERWLAKTQFRQDITPALKAEGVQAFMVQAMATNFCALHNTQSIQARLMPYLAAWLTP
ncbi:putative TetR family transcriptional regulator [Octadecabacter antarcticus 307]|uniref:Putative TetR family transcriptional regulator n=1 Tax=Octadecabacter antarcticus 307 TaxID=391626 RepID=M9RC05_9RHOB|nr:TetR/AcrR family transcriptional regulator [Octadecabacter antarcticus]AGI69717.1 putative TetR family transcriptional regulator [Octadecabacter antarcticus 307]